MTDRIKRAVLVYQAGIANVFRVSTFNQAPHERHAVRLLQSDFRMCESFARGLAAAGVTVTTFGCNQPGDVTNAHWSEDLEGQPFSDKFSPVFAGIERTPARDVLS